MSDTGLNQMIIQLNRYYAPDIAKATVCAPQLATTVQFKHGQSVYQPPFESINHGS